MICYFVDCHSVNTEIILVNDSSQVFYTNHDRICAKCIHLLTVYVSWLHVTLTQKEKVSAVKT